MAESPERPGWRRFRITSGTQDRDRSQSRGKVSTRPRANRTGLCSQRSLAWIARYPDRMPAHEREALEQHAFRCEPCGSELRRMGGRFAELERGYLEAQVHERIYSRVSRRIASDARRC